MSDLSAANADDTPIDDLVHAYSSSPDDKGLFKRLEARLIVEGDWSTLADVYQQRSEAPALRNQTAERVEMMLRRGQVLEERSFEPQRALEIYNEVIRLEPENRIALRQMRCIYEARDQWDMVLQISDMENELPMEPYEKARFQAERGIMWARVGDSVQAEEAFRCALDVDPAQLDALAGLGRLLIGAERYREAVGIYERLVNAERGPNRAAALVELGRCLAGPLNLEARAIECYRRALTEDPRSHEAVEALAENAAKRQQWPLLADLYERRFDLAAGARVRTNIALQAARLHADHLNDPGLARMWFNRSIELGTEDPSAFESLAELERLQGNDEGLRHALDRFIELSPEVPTGVLFEASELCNAAGNKERALTYLQRAHEQSPDDALVLEALSDSLSATGRDGQRVDVLERRASHHEETIDARTSFLIEIAHIHEANGDPEGVVSAYERAFALDPTLPGAADVLCEHYRKAGDVPALRNLLEDLRERGPENYRANASSELGNLHLEDGHSDAAVEAFEFALRWEARHPRALAGLAAVARDRGDCEELVSALERAAHATTAREELEALVSELVPLLEESDRQAEAVSWLERLLVRTPDHTASLETLARLHRASGDDRALAATLTRREALEQASTRASLCFELGQVYERLEEAETATNWFEAAADADPDSRDALDHLIERERASERWEPLCDHLRELADRLGSNEACEARHEGEERALRQEIATLLEERLADPSAASRVLSELAEHDDCDEETHDHLEALLERTGRFDELLAHIARRADGAERAATNEAEGIAKRRSFDLRRAGLLADRLGRFSDAASVYHEIAERDPYCFEANQGLERTLRAADDHAGLALLFEDRAAASEDLAERARLRLEQATHLERAEDTEGARVVYADLADPERRERYPKVSLEALDRLLEGYERSADWESLRSRLDEELPFAESSADTFSLHLRLAALCRDRLGDHATAIDHLEAAVATAPNESAEAWRRLAELYADCDEPENLLRAIDGELGLCSEPEREFALRIRAGRLCARDLANADGAQEYFERALELEPSNVEAAEFLASRYELEGEDDRLRDVLERRLDALRESANDEDRETRTTLRLRIAALQDEDDAGFERTARLLEDAESENGCEARIAEALLVLHERRGDARAIADLCSRAMPGCSSGAERMRWQHRRARALREAGEVREAAEAFRTLIEDGATDPEHETVLCELYRELDDPEQLAAMLQRSIDRGSRTREDELTARCELAQLLADRLDRDEDALEQWQRIHELAPERTQAVESALALAEKLGHVELGAELIEKRLEANLSRGERGELQHRRAKLLDQTLGRPEEAAAAYRAALEAHPDRRETRSSLRAVLEGLGQWSEALEHLEIEASGLPQEDRLPLLEHGAATAARELGSEASLPWLERIRALRPGDLQILARIAEVHRAAGRPESVLRVLDARLSLAEDDGSKRDLQVDRARVFERDLASPARAAQALEAALELAPNDAAILRDLDRLYGQLGRSRDQFDTIETRVKLARGSDAVALHRRAAELASGPLADPTAAVRHWKATLQLSTEKAEHAELLSSLAEAQRAAGDVRATTDTLELQLAQLPPNDPARTRFHLQLARLHDEEFADEQTALVHLRELLDGSHDLESDERSRIETSVLEKLERRHEYVELDRRLHTSLTREAGHAEGWLALARLRDERLCSPAAAAEAAAHAVRLAPEDGQCLRTLRTLSERLGNWSDAARVLELEVAAYPPGAIHERAAALRRIGELRATKLDQPEAALKAYEKAIELVGADARTLASLQDLCERLDQPERVLQYAEQEIALLSERGDEQSASVQAASLRAARIARTSLGDAQRALAAFETAGQCGALEADDQRTWAELYDEADRPAEFADRFGDWMDTPGAAPTGDDALRLTDALCRLGRLDEAADRSRLACKLDSHSRDAWDARAALAERLGNEEEAAEAYERAATLSMGIEAAERWLDAASLREIGCPAEALERVRRAVEQDPSFARAQAELARLADIEGLADEAQDAASAALDLLQRGASVDAAPRLAAALAGGRAAQQRKRNRAALLFYSTVLEIAPNNAEALSAQADMLLDAQDFENARPLLERRLALDCEDPQRAHHEAMLGTALQRAGDNEQAVEHFRAALELDPASSRAHAGLTTALEATERFEEATSSLEAWACSEAPADERGAAWLRAADLHARSEDVAAVERALRGAVDVDAQCHPGWARLAELLHDQARHAEAIEIVTAARTQQPPSDVEARFCMVAGRAHEEQGESGPAIEAFRDACTLDPWNIEAALAANALLRRSNDFEAASNLLESFVAAHPQASDARLADVFAERARLLSGPLEKMEDAIEAYRAAIDRQPDNHEWQQRLAGLLAHVPQRWREAATLHREILMSRPTSIESIRALSRIASHRGRPELAERGTGFLAILGAAAPGEHQGMPLRGADTTRRRLLDDPVGEALREAFAEIRDDLLQCGAITGNRDGDANAEDLAADTIAFRHSVTAAGDEISAPGLLRESPERLGTLFMSVACLAIEQDDSRADSELVARLAETVSRRSRKRLRRLMEEIGLDQVSVCDPLQWQIELNAAAGEAALARGNYEVRTALLALCDGAPDLADTEDPNLSDLIDGSPIARCLLNRLVTRWCRSTGTL